MPAGQPRTISRGPQPSSLPATLEEEIRARLEQRRLELADEIRHYPSPIAGCDQQFNWLLEQHDRLRVQLQHLDALCATARTAEERAARVRTFDPERVPHTAYPHDSVHS
jgi:hypothetical protein